VAVVSSTIELSTHGDAQVVDITDQVREKIACSGLSDGIGCVFVPGATGGVTTIEYEPGCVADLQALFDRLAPSDRDYEHERRWGDGNGHSHLRAALLGPSLSFPFNGGAPSLGTWQQIVFVDFDNRPRSRKILVQLVGE
jgi:secondary thiamine-phosphate synthase enzyme